MLFLNKRYYKNLGEEKVDKYLVLILISYMVSVIIGYKEKRDMEILMSLVSNRKEKSIFNIGQMILIQASRFNSFFERLLSNIISYLITVENKNYNNQLTIKLK